MGWVLKELRTDLADAVREDAERDARRIRRAAGRAANRVGDELRELEALALELQGAVRRQRLSTVPPAPAPSDAAVAAPRARAARRASMRQSPLADLLRASEGGGRFPRALLEARR
jgi:hypothetical protein